jgi:hypothetical protein
MHKNAVGFPHHTSRFAEVLRSIIDVIELDKVLFKVVVKQSGVAVVQR